MSSRSKGGTQSKQLTVEKQSQVCLFQCSMRSAIFIEISPQREMDKKSKGSPQTRFQTSDLSISSICFPPTKIKRKNVSKWQVVREENKSDLFVGILLQKASKSGLHFG